MQNYKKKRQVAIVLPFMVCDWRGCYGRYAPVAGAGEEGQPVHLKSYQEIQRWASPSCVFQKINTSVTVSECHP
jgi:hypothetical protein